MQIPGFKIERVIAEGGMSSVYLALQKSLGRSVAVKVLDKIKSRRDARRFVHEARIIASLQHRNIITIYDVGAVGGRHYIAMEYLEGGSLTERIEQGMSPKQALDLLETLAACLAFVHRRGIVHGDIKPENILFHRDGTPKLSDFGIAERGEHSRRTDADGKIYGSPHYLSPEQAEGLPRDGRSDIYGLGIVFHQMLTGQLPYEGDSDVEIIVAHLSSPIPLLPEAVSGCQRLLEQMIAKRPADRVRDAGELLRQIREARARMTRRGRLIAAISRLLTAAPVPRRAMWPSVLRMPLAGRIVAATGILLVLTLGLGGLSREAGPDRAAATEAAATVPELSRRRQAPLDAPQPETTPAVATTTAAGPPPSTAFASKKPPESERFAQPPPEPAAVHGGRKISAEAMHESVEIAAIPSASTASEVVVPQMPQPERRQPGRPTEPATRSPSNGSAAPNAALPAILDQDTKIAGWLASAEQALAADRLTTPSDDNAYDRYRKVLELVPDHAKARAGMNQIAERYASMGRQALAANKTSLARVYLARGRHVREHHPALIRLGEALEATEPRVVDVIPQMDPPDVRAAVPEPVRDTAFDFENVGDPARERQGSGNVIKDFKSAWRSVFN